MLSFAALNKINNLATAGVLNGGIINGSIAASETQSEISSAESNWSDLRAIALKLGVQNPDELVTERFKVDRQKLEQLIKSAGPDPVTNGAEQFFDNIMKTTETFVSWPCRLKVGAKSKKDPHVRIVGKRDEVNKAKERILAALDARGSRVIMKMDVSYTDHSFIIGRGGNNIKRIMEETQTHIHFPDSNRSNPTEKSNQVSLCGTLEGVEHARALVRLSAPLLISFELPVLGHGKAQADHDTPYIKMIELKYNVQVIFSTRPKLHSSLVLVKGAERDAEQVKEATKLLIEYTCETIAQKISVNVQMEISPQHHDVVKGKDNVNLLNIMKRTTTKIIFPDLSDANVKPLKKSQVTITGRIVDVYTARQQLLGNLPVALIFDYPETNSEASDILRLSTNYGVYITLRQKQRQSQLAIVIKGMEKFVDKIYEARNEILNLVIPAIKPEVPVTYFAPEDKQFDSDYRTQLTSLLSGYPDSPKSPNYMPAATTTTTTTITKLNAYNMLNQSNNSNSNNNLGKNASCSSSSSSNINVNNKAEHIIANSDMLINNNNNNMRAMLQAHNLSVQQQQQQQQQQFAPNSFAAQKLLQLQNGHGNSRDKANYLTLMATMQQQQQQQQQQLVNLHGKPTTVLGPPPGLTQHMSPRNSYSSGTSGTSGYQSLSSSTTSLEQGLNALSGFTMPTCGNNNSNSNNSSSAAFMRQTYLNAFADAELAQARYGRRSSDGALLGLSPSNDPAAQLCKLQYDFRNNPSYDFDPNRALAYKLMERKPLPGELRTPTPSWMGMGLSRTSPVPATASNAAAAAGDSLNPNNWQRANSIGYSTAAYKFGVTTGLIEATPLNRRMQLAQHKDIHTLLANIGLEHYIKTFVLNEIDLEIFETLTEENLIELGISAFGARKKMLCAILALQTKHHAAAVAAAAAAGANGKLQQQPQPASQPAPPPPPSAAAAQKTTAAHPGSTSPRFSGSAAPGAERRPSAQW